MDRNALTASVLIALIMVVWFVWFTPEPVPLPEPPSERPDTTVVSPEAMEGEVIEPPAVAPSAVDSTLLAAQQGDVREIVVRTDLYTARFSTRGATLTSFTLNTYNKFDQQTPVEMVDTTGSGALSVLVTPRTGNLIDSRTLFFAPASGIPDMVTVDEATGPQTLAFTAQVGDGQLRITYTFAPETYEIGMRVDQTIGSMFSNTEGYDLVWHGGVPFTENDPEQEALSTAAYVHYGGDVVKVGLDGEETENELFTGEIEWVAVSGRFFASFILPETEKTEGAELAGERRGEPGDPLFFEDYGARVIMSRPAVEGDTFRLYVGPIEFARISDYGLGLYDVVDYGFGQTITRPIAKYLIVPTFALLSRFIPNYGVIIILFALLVKLLLYPLTKSSFKSMARMRQMQPQMQEIKEKYGDDPQKQQEAMMRLYRESGVNPLGSCLPQLLQLPILYALFRFFPSAIEIRQEAFLWANDLSAPDAILNLPFTLPFYGDYVAGFTLLMGVSLFAQMKIQGGMATGQSAAQQKIFQYVFPTMLIVFFNRFASGLSLYYLTYNLVTAVQQRFINKHIDEEQDKVDGSGGKRPGRSGKAASKRSGGDANKRTRKGPRTTSSRRNGQSAKDKAKARSRRSR